MLPPMTTELAGATLGAAPRGGGTQLSQVLMWVLLLIVAFVVLLWLAMWFRRQFLGGPKGIGREPAGFSITDLRRLRDQGKITAEEYERTRERLVHSAQVAIAQAAQEDGGRFKGPQTKDVDLIREAER
jgi:hypothetical protein